MGKQKPSAGKKRTILILSLVLALVLLAAEVCLVAVLERDYVEIQGQRVRRDTLELDLRGEDLRISEYTQLCQELPQCHILWDIPLGSRRYENTAQSISVTQVDEQLLEALPFFEDLQIIDATAVASPADLKILEENAPGCEILWTVHIAGQQYDPATMSLDFSGTEVTVSQLLESLGRFDRLTQVSLAGHPLSAGDRAELKEAFPHLSFLWDVTVLGKTFRNTDTLLSFAGETVDVQALAAAAPEFSNVEKIDLSGCGLTLADLTLLQEAWPGTFLLSELTLYGKTFTTDAQELDFSGIPMDSTEPVAQMAALMPSLTKVDMCDCGLSNEEMDALNRQFDNTLFVWRVHFSVYSLRTDATYFCASDLPQNGYVAIKMTDEQLEPLKYCTELIALDLGHMYYTDLSFLENMPKLQYLILVEARFRDISPIGGLKELKYLELFVNTFEDLTPLLECTNLRHLNIGFTRGFDPSVLKEMVWLERLWYPGHSQNEDTIAEIRAALPDTEFYAPSYDTDGSTGHGWREAEIYFEMRDIFRMHYMPGGTGTDNL